MNIPDEYVSQAEDVADQVRNPIFFEKKLLRSL